MPGRPCDFYVGPSMIPTLKPLDRLTMADYGARAIRPGDVVVFRSPTDGRRVTHRVVTSNAEGIITRGDNNDVRDPWRLTREMILGQVTSARRNGRWITIHGGPRGRMRATKIRFVRHGARTVFRLMQAAYRPLAKKNRLKLKLRKVFRIIYFQRPEGTEFHLLIGSRVVATQSPQKDRWLLNRPYSWFLSEKCLPAPPDPIKRGM